MTPASLLSRLKELEAKVAPGLDPDSYVFWEIVTALRNALPEILIALERVGELERGNAWLNEERTKAWRAAEAAEQRVAELEGALAGLEIAMPEREYPDTKKAIRKLLASRTEGRK